MEPQNKFFTLSPKSLCSSNMIYIPPFCTVLQALCILFFIIIFYLFFFLLFLWHQGVGHCLFQEDKLLLETFCIKIVFEHFLCELAQISDERCTRVGSHRTVREQMATAFTIFLCQSGICLWVRVC